MRQKSIQLRGKDRRQAFRVCYLLTIFLNRELASKRAPGQDGDEGRVITLAVEMLCEHARDGVQCVGLMAQVGNLRSG